MKKIFPKILLLFLFVNAASTFSQIDGPIEGLDDIELNQIQWELVRDHFAVEAIKMLARIDTLNYEIDSLKQVLVMIDNYDCEAELYALVGATKEQVADYRKKLDEAESLVSSNNTPYDAANRIFSELNNSKIKCLPEFNERVSALKKNLETVGYTEARITDADFYEVVYGDVLTGISLKFFGTVDKWKLIWESNRSEIEDPDFIYPGQILKIPADLR